MIVTLPVHQAEARLSDLIARVARGDEVVLTEEGVPVARLVAPELSFDREKAYAAAVALWELGKTASLGESSIRDLIDEGRR